jgi:5-formyltetrahydrofolate cyclo-ligase
VDDAALRHGAKRMMRQRFRSRRAALPGAAVAQRSTAICERLVGLAEIADAATVALFWPMVRFKEVDLRPLDAVLRARGVTLAYPAIEPDSDDMRFVTVANTADLAERGKGFAEPSPQAPVLEKLDVIVVPGLVFDLSGYRIGYGAGYYDRTLPRFAPPATTVGVAFDFQLAPDVPHEPGDVPVQIVVSDVRLHRVGAAGDENA